MAEGPGKADIRKLRTTFRDGTLSGDKVPVPDGDVADVAIVVAQGERGVALALVDLKAAGVTREDGRDHRSQPLACTRDLSTARPPKRSAIPARARVLRRLQDRAAVLFAFEQVGGAQRALEMARDYALERYAFGRPIGSYQAIKHKLADVYVATELARSNAYYGAWALHRDAPELPLAAAAARIAANDAFFLASKENIQTARRHRLHLGGRLPPLLPPRQLLALALGAPRLWKDRLVTQLETANAAL